MSRGLVSVQQQLLCASNRHAILLIFHWRVVACHRGFRPLGMRLRVGAGISCSHNRRGVTVNGDVAANPLYRLDEFVAVDNLKFWANLFAT